MYNMSIEQPIITQSQKDEIIDYVNAYRARHGYPPMKLFIKSYVFFTLRNST